MNVRVVCLFFALSVSACAGTPEPETPAPVAPTKRPPSHGPLPPAPSNTPEIVYASVAPVALDSVMTQR